jgi:hypothetical protein
MFEIPCPEHEFKHSMPGTSVGAMCLYAIPFRYLETASPRIDAARRIDAGRDEGGRFAVHVRTIWSFDFLTVFDETSFTASRRAGRIELEWGTSEAQIVQVEAGG